MKALSIKQPWASLIAHGIKDVENRTWKTKFRGKIFIHASAKKVELNVMKILNEKNMLDAISEKQYFFLLNDTVRSAIIGEVEIVDCVINHESIWAEKGFNYASWDGTGYKEVYNWVLANPVLYDKPILNVKGKLSFWEPDIDIVECIGCSGKFNFEEMEQDDASENYCNECWEVLSPIMAQEARECREN